MESNCMQQNRHKQKHFRNHDFSAGIWVLGVWGSLRTSWDLCPFWGERDWVFLLVVIVVLVVLLIFALFWCFLFFAVLICSCWCVVVAVVDYFCCSCYCYCSYFSYCCCYCCCSPNTCFFVLVVLVLVVLVLFWLVCILFGLRYPETPLSLQFQVFPPFSLPKPLSSKSFFLLSLLFLLPLLFLLLIVFLLFSSYYVSSSDLYCSCVSSSSSSSSSYFSSSSLPFPSFIFSLSLVLCQSIFKHFGSCSILISSFGFFFLMFVFFW